jgi:hypothetical protein
MLLPCKRPAQSTRPSPDASMTVRGHTGSISACDSPCNAASLLSWRLLYSGSVGRGMRSSRAHPRCVPALQQRLRFRRLRRSRSGPVSRLPRLLNGCRRGPSRIAAAWPGRKLRHLRTPTGPSRCRRCAVTGRRRAPVNIPRQWGTRPVVWIVRQGTGVGRHV